MPVDNVALAAAALAAAQVPLWHKPAPTDFGPTILTQSHEGQFHPRVEVVQATLAGLSQTARLSVLQARLAWLSTRKTAAESALTALGLAADLPTSIAATSLKATDWPLGQVDLRVRRLEFRLKAGQSRHDTQEDTSTDQALAALGDATVLTAAAAQPAATAGLLLQMRCLADIYARWESCARLTSAVVGAQLASPPLSNAEMLARTLTYSRIEGDMSIPPEDDTLEGSDPGADSNKIPLPPGRSRFFPYLSPSAYMCCVTYLALPKDFTFNGQDVNLADPATMTKVADESFTLVLGGLDVLWSLPRQKAEEQLFPDDPNPFNPVDLLDWPALNRQIPATVTHANARAAAAADLTARRGLLISPGRLKGPAGSQASRTAPISAADYKADFSGAGANYAELVLSEGVRYLNRLTYGPVRFGPGAPSRLPEILVYCLYHMGAESKGLLASAAANALRSQSKSSYATALAAAMHNAGLGTDLTTILASVHYAHTTELSVKIATDSWKEIAGLLATPAVTAALADYLRHENDKVWKSWVKPPSTPDDPEGRKGSSPRGNCIGYAQLYEYLTAQVH